MKLSGVIKRNALLFSMMAGAILYAICEHTKSSESQDPLELLAHFLPIGIFAILYVTFCKIKIKELRVHSWHFVIQMVRTSFSAMMVLLIVLFGGHADVKLVLEGMFICFICPTASAVVVVAEKLGGSVASLTIFTMIANVVTMVIIPLFFPIVEREADISFLSAMMMVLRNVTMVLVVPLTLALASRRFIPRFVRWLSTFHNVGFYIWCFNLMIVTSITLRNITHSSVSGWVLWALLFTPLLVCLIQFATGKAIGRHFGDSISAGQALGQKNTVVGIWLTLTFLNPLVAVAPGAYVLWQNLVNSYQIWHKEKYGYLRW